MIVFWGDSLFAGPAEAGYIPVFLSELLNADIRPMAVGGAFSSETLALMKANVDLLEGVTVISTGRCNYHEPDQIMADFEAMLKLIPHDRLLILPLIQSKRRGTEGHSKIAALNGWFRSRFDDYFIDVYGFLRREGLARSGITPTRRDLRDIAGGIVPASLRCDGIHPNAIGNRLIAGLFAKEIVGRDWAAYHIDTPISDARVAKPT
jgi:hypothetical protein